MADEATRHLEQLFRIELEEGLEALDGLLGNIEERDTIGDDARREALRAAHSLKGAARAVGELEIEQRCHELEDALVDPSAGGEARPVTRVPSALRALRAASQRLLAGAGHATDPLPADGTPAVAGRREAWMTVPTERFDRLVADAERLVSEAARVVEDARSETPDLRHLASLDIAAQTCVRSLRDAHLVPFEDACRGLGADVRDLARDLGRSASLEIRGADVEIARAVAHALRDPLRHLVRNAVVHGIEPPSLRTDAGKPEEGRVSIDARLVSHGLHVVVADDGRGINPIITGPTEGGDASGTDAIFADGYTTTEAVTTIAGRGVGLAIVRAAIESLGGGVAVHAVPGVGTEVSIRVPLAASSMRLLITRAAGIPIAFPLHSTRRVVPARCIEGEYLIEEGRPIPVVDLDRGNVPAPDGGGYAVVVDAPEGRVAVRVDTVTIERELVVRPSRLAHGNPVIATALLGGQLVPIIGDVSSLVAHAHGSAGRPLAARRVLVVDDSATWRQRAGGLLEDAGCLVTAVRDGFAALEVLRENSFDVVVSDVMMPGLSGLELCAAVKARPEWSGLPFILMSSMESDTDRQRGREVGADAYIGKSDVDGLADVVGDLL